MNSFYQANITKTKINQTLSPPHSPISPISPISPFSPSIPLSGFSPVFAYSPTSAVPNVSFFPQIPLPRKYQNIEPKTIDWGKDELNYSSYSNFPMPYIE